MYGSIKLVNSEKNLLYNFPYGPILELCLHMASILDFQYILSRIIQGAMRSTKVTFGTIAGDGRKLFDQFFRNIVSGTVAEHPKPKSIKITKVCQYIEDKEQK
jgi:hypothetical protein